MTQEQGQVVLYGEILWFFWGQTAEEEIVGIISHVLPRVPAKPRTKKSP